MVLMGMQSDCSEKRVPQGQAASLFFQERDLCMSAGRERGRCQWGRRD